MTAQGKGTSPHEKRYRGTPGCVQQAGFAAALRRPPPRTRNERPGYAHRVFRPAGGTRGTLDGPAGGRDRDPDGKQGWLIVPRDAARRIKGDG